MASNVSPRQVSFRGYAEMGLAPSSWAEARVYIFYVSFSFSHPLILTFSHSHSHSPILFVYSPLSRLLILPSASYTAISFHQKKERKKAQQQWRKLSPEKRLPSMQHKKISGSSSTTKVSFCTVLANPVLPSQMLKFVQSIA